MSYMECRHIKTNGCKCQSPALRGKPYCYYHERLHRVFRNQKSQSEPASASMPDDLIDFSAVEDRSAIQLALTQVLRGMGSRRIDPRFGTQLLYGLQIAAQLIDRAQPIEDSGSVQTIATNEDGDELGPPQFVCKKEEKCDDCPYVDQCTRWVATNDDEDEEADGVEDEIDEEDDE